MSDTAVKLAIEEQSMQQAMAYLELQGYSTSNVSRHQSFDILASSKDEELRVEVKGSSGVATAVEVTIGEVNIAKDSRCKSALIVVDQIPFQKRGGVVTTKPGRLRFWPEWEQIDDRLQPLRFNYLLPPPRVEIAQ